MQLFLEELMEEIQDITGEEIPENETYDETVKMEDIQEILLNTREQCQMVDQLIHNQIEVKDSLINRLHEELQYYKKDANDQFE